MKNEQESEEIQFFNATRIKAEQGNDWAQDLLGLRYYNGEVVPKNYVESAKWFWKAAEHGGDNEQ